MKKLTSVVLTALLLSLPAFAEGTNLARNAKVTASSERPGNPAKAVADGAVDDESRWLAAEDASTWVELSFPKPVNIGIVDVFSGWKDEPGLDGFDLAFEVDGKPVSTPPR